MPKPKRKREKKNGLRMDFAGDGGPYSEVIVKISIRILDDEITRSRLAVNVYPDPALEPIARQSLEALRKDNYGYDDRGVFGACLSENFNAWEDMNKDYPRIDEKHGDLFRQDDAKKMNTYIAASVKWALELHRLGIQEARSNQVKSPPERPQRPIM